jgi:ANTH domain
MSSLATTRNIDHTKFVAQQLSFPSSLDRFASALFIILISSYYRSEGELAINIRKATSIEETAPKRKHVRSCIVYTWDHKSSGAFWAGMKVLVITIISLLVEHYWRPFRVLHLSRPAEIAP